MAPSSAAIASFISGFGMNVPPRVVKNSHFASYLETSDEWIQDRTGIQERRWADPDVAMSEIAAPACTQAIERAGLKPEEIDGIIVATVTPDFVFPSTACCLQRRLGIKRGFAFDMNAVCSGFVYALTVANGLISSGQGKNLLVVGADMFSRLVNPTDRTTCVLFGDGAGAVVLSKATGGSRGIYRAEIQADGSLGDLLCVPNGTAKPATPERIAKGEHYLTMNGREIFKLAVRAGVELGERLLTEAGFQPEELTYFVSHQANKRILDAIMRQLELPPEKLLVNVERYGNTSAASIPVLLAESAAAGKIKQGDVLMLSAFGGGITWGGLVLRW